MAAAALWVVATTTSIMATPSTEYWTPGTTDIQAFGIGHIGIDNYFHVANSSSEAGDAFATDLQYTVGILPFSKLNMEVGIDFMGSLNYPVMFNTKLGIPEDGFFKGQPGLAVGIFNVGTKKDVTDYNIVYGAIGKTIPLIGRFFVGGYTGNKTTLGGITNEGITLAWDRSFIPTKSAGGVDYYRIILSADVATGKNAYGGGGGGIYYFFNENISLLAGPVFFADKDINGKWKLTTQLDINFKNW